MYSSPGSKVIQLPTLHIALTLSYMLLIYHFCILNFWFLWHDMVSTLHYYFFLNFLASNFCDRQYLKSKSLSLLTFLSTFSFQRMHLFSWLLLLMSYYMLRLSFDTLWSRNIFFFSHRWFLVSLNFYNLTVYNL